MKIWKYLALVMTIITSNLLANGVAIIDATTGDYFELIDVNVTVDIESQVATTNTQQTFVNTSRDSQKVKFGFPIPETASVTALRWQIKGQWYRAQLTATPQDTTLPGSGNDTNYDLKTYLGNTPLYFNIPQTIEKSDTIIIITSYVDLLSYSSGKVTYAYPNNYQRIQSAALASQRFEVKLNSQKTINQITCLSSHPVSQYTNSGNTGYLVAQVENSSANENFEIEYQLDSEELGIFSLSTMLPDSVLPDPYGGFFLFVAEPDPRETTGTIRKRFTLIIDRSGSMKWVKIEQARNAASFIVENLNEGDLFNIVDFADGVNQFRDTHCEYTSANKNQALTYIDGIYPGGGTNISAAFDHAIPQFTDSDDETANIIIFFTDGEATNGTTDTDELSNRVKLTVAQTEKNISIFTFGVGDDVNKRLLTLLANENNGFSEFLGSDALENRITEFYLQVRNPVLINTHIDFSSNSISETYPDQLPNLYKGQQFIMTGRYSEPGSVQLTLSGMAFGNPVEYVYTLELAESEIETNQFLPKVWAKQKIEELLVQYYLLPQGSESAEVLKQQIIEFSISYGVMSPFTSYTDYDDDDISSEVEEVLTHKINPSPNDFELMRNYPNPFNPSTTLRFKVNSNFTGPVFIRIYNTLGQLVKILQIQVTKAGIYEIMWDGTNRSGLIAPSGTYVYVIDFGKHLLAGQMQLIN